MGGRCTCSPCGVCGLAELTVLCVLGVQLHLDNHDNPAASVGLEVVQRRGLGGRYTCSCQALPGNESCSCQALPGNELVYRGGRYTCSPMFCQALSGNELVHKLEEKCGVCGLAELAELCVVAMQLHLVYLDNPATRVGLGGVMVGNVNWLALH